MTSTTTQLTIRCPGCDHQQSCVIRCQRCGWNLQQTVFADWLKAKGTRRGKHGPRAQDSGMKMDWNNEMTEQAP